MSETENETPWAEDPRGLLRAGDIDGARRASANAKTWCWVATALAIIGLMINIGWFAMGGMASSMDLMQQMQGM